MIALPQRLPHVIWKNGRLVPLSEGWLAESIEHAAAGAGYHRWHLAPEVARAIAVYLEDSISLTELASYAPYELEFYPLLKQRLGDALEVQVAGVRLEGLRDCSKILDSAGRWRRTCVRISDEIIYFCRTYMNHGMLRTVDLVIQ